MRSGGVYERRTYAGLHLLVLDDVDEPVEALCDTLALDCAGRDDGPAPVLELCEVELLGDL